MIRSPFSLEGKTILITGASSGIGRAAAVECSRAGAARCVLVARDTIKLNETASMLDEHTQTIICSCDLTDTKSVEAMVAELPKIDGVLCNAGTNRMKLLPFVSESEIERVFSVNCFSPMILMKLLVKKKKLNNPSSVVFMASISGHSNVSYGNSVYGASKAALSAYMKYAALELAPKGVRCNAIYPGRVETPLISSSPVDEEMVKMDKEKYPLKRYGDPKEIAWAVVYLLSDATSWMTGSDLVIDGGRSLT